MQRVYFTALIADTQNNAKVNLDWNSAQNTPLCSDIVSSLELLMR